MNKVKRKAEYKFLVIRFPDGAMLTFHTKDPSLVGLLSTMKKEAIRRKRGR